MKNSFKITQYFVCMIATMIGAPAMAAFEVINEPNVEYGNAQNEVFRKAVEFEDSLDSTDRAFLSTVEQKRVSNRWYYEAQIGRPEIRVKDVMNETTGMTGQPANRSTEDDLFLFVIGWGYKWNRFATELELVISESVDYRSNPILTGQTIQVDADIQNVTLFWNFEYEIPTFFDFIPSRVHPYVNVGFGPSFKTVDTRSLSLGNQARQTTSERSTDFAYNLSAGVKFQLTANILVGGGYRYMNMGEADIGPIEGIKLSADEYTARGFFVGLTYLS